MFAQTDNIINSINVTAGEKKTTRGDEAGLHHKQYTIEQTASVNTRP